MLVPIHTGGVQTENIEWIAALIYSSQVLSSIKFSGANYPYLTLSKRSIYLIHSIPIPAFESNQHPPSLTCGIFNLYTPPLHHLVHLLCRVQSKRSIGLLHHSFIRHCKHVWIVFHIISIESFLCRHEIEQMILCEAYHPPSSTKNLLFMPTR